MAFDSTGIAISPKPTCANTVSPSKMHMKGSNMKSNNLKNRLQKNRPMDVISLRMPKDVVDDLKRIAPLLGFSGYQPLIRAYIGQGLRVDLERIEGGPDIAKFVESLKRRGVTENVISEAMAEFSGR